MGRKERTAREEFPLSPDLNFKPKGKQRAGISFWFFSKVAACPVLWRRGVGVGGSLSLSVLPWGGLGVKGPKGSDLSRQTEGAMVGLKATGASLESMF